MLRLVARRLATPLLVLLLLLPALACNIGREDMAWQTYESDEYGYAISFPRDWAIEVQPIAFEDEIETAIVLLSGTTWRLDGSVSQDRVIVAVNYRGGWCERPSRVQSRDVVSEGAVGWEQACYRLPDEECAPLPNCRSAPYALVRHFEAAMPGRNYTVIAEPLADEFLVKRILESFRFRQPARPPGS